MVKPQIFVASARPVDHSVWLYNINKSDLTVESIWLDESLVIENKSKLDQFYFYTYTETFLLKFK